MNSTIDVNEAAKIIGVSRLFACQLMDRGLLKFALVGAERQTTLKDVNDYLEKRDLATGEYAANIANHDERLSVLAQDAITLTESEKQSLQEL